MIIGTFVVAASGGDRTFYTPWFPRGADNALFAYELFYDDLSGDPFSVEIEHKDAEDPGSAPANPPGSFAQLGSTDIYQANATGLKDLVRFAVTVPAFGSAGESVSFRFLSPTWYATANVP
jgi:hypothetical protein